jgi:hypothetical protein
MLDTTRVSRNQLQVQLKARMLKSRVINEVAQTGLYTRGSMHAGRRGTGGKSLRARLSTCARWSGHGCGGNDWWERARTDRRGCGLICEAQTRRALIGGKGSGRVGPGTDSSRESGNGRDHRDRARTGVATHTTTIKQTRVLTNKKLVFSGVDKYYGRVTALIEFD